MKKRILTVLLAVCLVFALGTVGALAAEGEACQGGDNCQHVAEYNNLHYSSLQDAIDATAQAEGQATVTILNDITLSGTDRTIDIPLGANIVINGNEKTLKGQIDCAATAADGKKTVNLTINNLTLDGEGITNGYGIRSQNQTANESTVVNLNLTLNNCKIQNFTYKGLYLTNAKSLTISGCTFTNNATAALDNPNTHGDYCVDLNLVAVKGSVISISNTTFSEDCGAKAAIKVTARGTTDGTNADDIKGELATISSLDIENCTFSQEDSAVDVRIGTDYKGTTDSAPISCNIEDNKTALFDFTIENSSDDAVEVELAYTKTEKDSGDESNPATPAKVETVPAGKTYTKTATGDFAESGTFEASVTHSGVTNNYSKLADAIANAQAGDTVKLLQNVSIDGSAIQNNYGVITIDKNLTLDGNGKEITITGVTGDAGTRPSAINIQNGADVTLKNLDVDSNGAKHGLNINGAGTVTLEDVEIMNSAWYAVVCNSSKLTVNGLYTHNNQWGVNVDKGSKVTFNNATITEEYSVVVDDGTTSSTNVVILNAGTYKNIQIKTENSNVSVNGGSYNNIVGGNSTDNPRYTLKGTEASIYGGTFNYRQMSAYEDANYLVVGGSKYSYYNDYSKALAAAGVGYDIICLNDSIDTYTVEFIYEKGVSDTYDVPEDTTIYLPTGTYEGKAIEGWKRDDGEVFDAGDRVKITRNTDFTVILRNGQYNIVIDDDIKHGDVSTDVSSADKGATVYIYVDPDIGYVLDDLNVYYGANNRYSVTVSYVRAGVYKFTMPNASVYITATFKYAALPFTDVNRNQWFYDEVFYVYTNGMMEGDSATTFNPDGRMTRAMFWAVLGRIDGATITGNDWAEEARAWAMREGVSDGTNPNDYVTREQMVTMLWRYAGEKNGSASLVRYTDADKISSYAVEAMRWAIGNGIIEGMTSTTLEPQGTATRAQCAAIFMRFDQM